MMDLKKIAQYAADYLNACDFRTVPCKTEDLSRALGITQPVEVTGHEDFKSFVRDVLDPACDALKLYLLRETGDGWLTFFPVPPIENAVVVKAGRVYLVAMVDIVDRTLANLIVHYDTSNKTE